jgi:hypothetical protein
MMWCEKLKRSVVMIEEVEEVKRVGCSDELEGLGNRGKEALDLVVCCV